ncbi:MAG: alpha/beta fold hydrolase [Kofleriaceae bacterium]
MFLQIAEHARTRPTDLALAFPCADRVAEYSWFELLASIQARSRLLIASGIRPGQVVGICTHVSEAQVLCFLSLLALGAVPTILSHPSSKQSESLFLERWRPLLQRGDVPCILCSEELAPLFRAMVAGHGLATLVVVISEPDPSSAVEPDLASVPDRFTFLQFSSGTTGLRKGVRVTHEMLRSQASRYAPTVGLVAGDCVASWLPLYHDMGLVGSLMIPLITGASSVHVSPFDWLDDPRLLFRLVSRYRATHIWLPNFAFRVLAERGQLSPSEVDLHSLRVIVNCGEPVRAISHQQLVERFAAHGLREDHIQVCYALAENTFAVTQSSLGRTVRRDRVRRSVDATGELVSPASPGDAEGGIEYLSCGRALPGTGIRISGGGPDGDRERRVGNVEIFSDSLFSAYIGGEQAQFTNDGWYRTGDVGYLADGELFLIGRLRDVIIHRGINLHPEDLEAVIDRVPGCKPGRAVAFGVDSAVDGTELLVVMVELTADADKELVVREIRRQVTAACEVTVHEVVTCPLGSLLKSTSGKPARGANRERYREIARTRGAPRSDQAPGSDLATVSTEAMVLRDVVEVWRTILELPDGFDPHANVFLDYGADSLDAAEAVAQLESRFGVSVSSTQLLEAGTALEQAALIGRRCTTGCQVTLRRGGDRAPLYLVRAAGANAFAYRELAAALGEGRPIHALQYEHPGPLDTYPTLTEMAGKYCDHLAGTSTTRRLILGGWSFGGAVAFEVARQLRDLGFDVPAVIMFDSQPPRDDRELLLFRVSRWMRRSRTRLAAISPVWRDTLLPCAGFFERTPSERLDLLMLMDWKQPQHAVATFILGGDPRASAVRRMTADEAMNYAFRAVHGNQGSPSRGAELRRRMAEWQLDVEQQARYRPASKFSGTVWYFGVQGTHLGEQWRAHCERLKIIECDVRSDIAGVDLHNVMMHRENVDRYLPALQAALAECDELSPARGSREPRAASLSSI